MYFYSFRGVLCRPAKGQHTADQHSTLWLYQKDAKTGALIGLQMLRKETSWDQPVFLTFSKMSEVQDSLNFIRLPEDTATGVLRALQVPA